MLASIGEYSEYNHLEIILEDAIFGKQQQSQNIDINKAKYENIKDFDLSKYKYNYHTKR